MVVAENGMLAESSLKFKEEFTNVKRIGTHMNLSKRLLKAKQYVVSFILNRLPLWVKFSENYQIMFGDGTGDNLKGITRYEAWIVFPNSLPVIMLPSLPVPLSHSRLQTARQS